jgi:hypothetical protein
MEFKLVNMNKLEAMDRRLENTFPNHHATIQEKC